MSPTLEALTPWWAKLVGDGFYVVAIFLEVMATSLVCKMAVGTATGKAATIRGCLVLVACIGFWWLVCYLVFLLMLLQVSPYYQGKSAPFW